MKKPGTMSNTLNANTLAGWLGANQNVPNLPCHFAFNSDQGELQLAWEARDPHHVPGLDKISSKYEEELKKYIHFIAENMGASPSNWGSLIYITQTSHKVVLRFSISVPHGTEKIIGVIMRFLLSKPALASTDHTHLRLSASLKNSRKVAEHYPSALCTSKSISPVCPPVSFHTGSNWHWEQPRGLQPSSNYACVEPLSSGIRSAKGEVLPVKGRVLLRDRLVKCLFDDGILLFSTDVFVNALGQERLSPKLRPGRVSISTCLKNPEESSPISKERALDAFLGREPSSGAPHHARTEGLMGLFAPFRTQVSEVPSAQSPTISRSRALDLFLGK